jgi:hypothetical protein
VLVLNGQDRLIRFSFFVSVVSRKCRRMQDTASVNLLLRLFPAVMCGPSRRQESEAFPCQLRRPFDFPVARCAISHTSPFSFPSLQVYANVPMPPFQTASVVIFVAGAKVKTGLGTQIF